MELRGIEPSRPSERPRMSRRRKTVNRSYGGVLCHKCVRDRIVRSFLIEEQKIVNKVLKQRELIKKKELAAVARKVSEKSAVKK